MTEQVETRRLFGTREDGVLYLSGPMMNAVDVKPGDKLEISVENETLRIRKANTDPRSGGTTD